MICFGTTLNCILFSEYFSQSLYWRSIAKYECKCHKSFSHFTHFIHTGKIYPFQDLKMPYFQKKIKHEIFTLNSVYSLNAIAEILQYYYEEYCKYGSIRSDVDDQTEEGIVGIIVLPYTRYVRFSTRSAILHVE